MISLYFSDRQAIVMVLIMLNGISLYHTKCQNLSFNCNFFMEKVFTGWVLSKVLEYLEN